MSIKYFCDFCKKEMPKGSPYIFFERVEYAKPLSREFEICRDCLSNILKYIDDKLSDCRKD